MRLKIIMETMLENVVTQIELMVNSMMDCVVARTGLSRHKIYAGVAMFGVLAYLTCVGDGPKMWSNLVGFTYPAYVAIDSTLKSEARELPLDRMWPTYWVTFMVITVAEQHAGALLWMLPYYWNLRAAFLVWCMLPIENNGTRFVHLAIVRKYVDAYAGGALPANIDLLQQSVGRLPVPAAQILRLQTQLTEQREL